jgi:hypothetical protein
MVPFHDIAAAAPMGLGVEVSVEPHVTVGEAEPGGEAAVLGQLGEGLAPPAEHEVRARDTAPSRRTTRTCIGTPIGDDKATSAASMP